MSLPEVCLGEEWSTGLSSPFISGCNIVGAEHIEDTIHEEDVLSQDMTKLGRDGRRVIESPGLEASLNALRSFEQGTVVRTDLPDDFRGD